MCSPSEQSPGWSAVTSWTRNVWAGNVLSATAEGARTCACSRSLERDARGCAVMKYTQNWVYLASPGGLVATPALVFNSLAQTN